MDALPQLYRNELNYTLEIPHSSKRNMIFFNDYFALRDKKRGLPYNYSRSEHFDDSVKFNFSSRELIESFLDKYDGEHFMNYLDAITEKSSESKECISDMFTALDFYELGYVIKGSSGGGRWDYYQVAIPGKTKKEIKNMFFTKYHSASKHKRNNASGFSPLLKLSAEPFLNYLSQNSLESKMTEQSYLLSKKVKASIQSHSQDFISELMNAEIDNADKLYFRMLKRWNKPLILFDNTADTDSFSFNLNFDEENLNNDLLKLFYPVFRDDEYPIPDVQHGSSSTMNYMEVVVDQVIGRKMQMIMLNSKKNLSEFEAHRLNTLQRVQADWEADLKAFDEF